MRKNVSMILVVALFFSFILPIVSVQGAEKELKLTGKQAKGNTITVPSGNYSKIVLSSGTAGKTIVLKNVKVDTLQIKDVAASQTKIKLSGNTVIQTLTSKTGLDLQQTGKIKRISILKLNASNLTINANVKIGTIHLGESTTKMKLTLKRDVDWIKVFGGNNRIFVEKGVTIKKISVAGDKNFLSGAGKIGNLNITGNSSAISQLTITNISIEKKALDNSYDDILLPAGSKLPSSEVPNLEKSFISQKYSFSTGKALYQELSKKEIQECIVKENLIIKKGDIFKIPEGKTVHFQGDIQLSMENLGENYFLQKNSTLVLEKMEQLGSISLDMEDGAKVIIGDIIITSKIIEGHETYSPYNHLNKTEKYGFRIFCHNWMEISSDNSYQLKNLREIGINRILCTGECVVFDQFLYSGWGNTKAAFYTTLNSIPEGGFPYGEHVNFYFDADVDYILAFMSKTITMTKKLEDCYFLSSGNNLNGILKLDPSVIEAGDTTSVVHNATANFSIMEVGKNYEIDEVRTIGNYFVSAKPTKISEKHVFSSGKDLAKELYHTDIKECVLTESLEVKGKDSFEIPPGKVLQVQGDAKLTLIQKSEFAVLHEDAILKVERLEQLGEIQLSMDSGSQLIIGDIVIKNKKIPGEKVFRMNYVEKPADGFLFLDSFNDMEICSNSSYQIEDLSKLGIEGLRIYGECIVFHKLLYSGRGNQDAVLYQTGESLWVTGWVNGYYADFQFGAGTGKKFVLLSTKEYATLTQKLGDYCFLPASQTGSASLVLDSSVMEPGDELQKIHNAIINFDVMECGKVYQIERE